MTQLKYSYPMFSRLEPSSSWTGSRLADTDLFSLERAARLASKHAGEEVTQDDFLSAAGRGEIRMHAIVHRSAKVKSHDGGGLFNRGQEDEDIVPLGAIPTLPLTACQHLANTGRASWRTFDGFETIDEELMRYTKGMLLENEPDFETVAADCRVTGYSVRALADAYRGEQDEPASPGSTQTAAPAPAPAEGETVTTKATGWTPERRAQLLAQFRQFSGKRPSEAGKKGERGALAKLSRATGVDKDTAGYQLDRAIEEKRRAEMWAKITTAM